MPSTPEAVDHVRKTLGLNEITLKTPERLAETARTDIRGWGAVMRGGPINVDQVPTRRYCLAPSATARSRDAASSAAFTGCPVSQPPMCRNATPHKASIHSFWSFRQSM